MGSFFRMDYNFPCMSDSLEDIVKSELPEFYKMCQGDEAERVLLHHAAFDESVEFSHWDLPVLIGSK